MKDQFLQIDKQIKQNKSANKTAIFWKRLPELTGNTYDYSEHQFPMLWMDAQEQDCWMSVVLFLRFQRNLYGAVYCGCMNLHSHQ